VPVRYCMSSKVAKKKALFRLIGPPRLPPKVFAVLFGLTEAPYGLASKALFCRYSKRLPWNSLVPPRESW